MSIFAPIVSDFMEKYVLNLDLFNFYSARNLKNSILGASVEELEESEIATELTFGEHIGEYEQKRTNLKANWNNIQAWTEYELTNSNENTTEKIDSRDIEEVGAFLCTKKQAHRNTKHT